MSAIQTMLKEIKALKPMPQIANQVMVKLEDPRSSLSDVANLVLFDPSLTINILRLCNSAYFGLPRKVDSVKEAISFLGLDQIIDLVLLNGTAQNFQKSQEGYGLNEGELWRHAVSSALIAKELATRKGVKRHHLVFTAALIKDIGKIIIDRYVEDAFNKIKHLMKNKQYSFTEAEKKVIGIDHAELGGIVAKMWKLSPKMRYIISNHHLKDDSAKNDSETIIVYIADVVCMMMGIGGGADGLAYRFHRDVLKQMDISQTDVQEIIANFGENMQKVEDLIRMA